jgi:hypothetical protein
MKPMSDPSVNSSGGLSPAFAGYIKKRLQAML